MSYIVKAVDGHSCGHHHRTLLGAIKCAALLERRAKMLSRRWKKARVYDEEIIRKIRKHRTLSPVRAA